jgi:hypothetical protein
MAASTLHMSACLAYWCGLLLTTQAPSLKGSILIGLGHESRELRRRLGTEDDLLHLRQLRKQRLHIDAPAACQAMTGRWFADAG